MKKSTFFLVLFFLAATVLVYCLERNPHDFSASQCALCHQGDPSSALSIAQTSLSQACRRCHQKIFDSGYMHPVDIAPQKVMIPRDMPLSRNGLLTCNTCHDVHGDYLRPDGSQSYFLRRNVSGKAFCAACHGQALLSGSDGHASLLGEAHFQSKYISSGYGQELDPMSKNCITCHDGAYASAVSVRTGSWQHSSNFNGSKLVGKHPIGIDYEMARLRQGRKTDLRPLASVDQRLVFFDGRMGCGTCHDPYSYIEMKLVMSNRRSALCFACHAMD